MTAKALTNEEFAAEVLRLCEGVSVQPGPHFYFDEENEWLEVVFSTEAFYAKFCPGPLTVYFSQETDKIVGFMVSGVKPARKS